MTDYEDKTNLSTYELRVRGHIGPVLLSALPHSAAARLPRRTLLIVEGSEQRQLVDIVRLIVGAGLELESIRLDTDTDPAE